MDRATTILDRAESVQDDRLALRAVAEARATLELVSKLTGEMAGAEKRAVVEVKWEERGLQMVEVNRPGFDGGSVFWKGRTHEQTQVPS